MSHLHWPDVEFDPLPGKIAEGPASILIHLAANKGFREFRFREWKGVASALSREAPGFLEGIPRYSFRKMSRAARSGQCTSPHWLSLPMLQGPRGLPATQGAGEHLQAAFQPLCCGYAAAVTVAVDAKGTPALVRGTQGDCRTVPLGGGSRSGVGARRQTP